MDGIVKTWPRILLRVEGATLFGSCIWAYAQTGASWWLFAGGLLLPDLGMIGFLKDSVTGAAIYNCVHTETPAILLLCTGCARRSSLLSSIGLIWLAHINMDRMIGAGLKYGTEFGHTHLSLMGSGFQILE